jgi:hypothetical protein
LGKPEEADEELDEAKKEEEGEEELDEAEEMDKAEQMDETMGGDAADDLIDDVEMEEEGMAMEDDDQESEDMADAELEDRVVDLEDKLDELMAEFESMMGGDSDTSDMDSDEMGDGDDFGAEEGGDAIEVDDTEEMMSENVALDKAPAPKTSEESFVNKKAVVAANSGQAGMEGAPVKMTGDTAQGRPAPKTQDLPDAGKFRNVPGKGGSNAKLDSAPKPVTSQATGVNTKTPFPKG